MIDCVYLDGPAVVFSEWEDHRWHSFAFAWSSCRDATYRLEVYGGDGEYIWRVSVGAHVVSKGDSHLADTAKNDAMSYVSQKCLEVGDGKKSTD